MTTLKILVFVGSVRLGRMVERVTKVVEKIVEQHKMQVTFLDPISLGPEAIVLNQCPLHFYADPEQDAPRWIRDVDELIRDSDGFLILSSEYNCGIPPALSNLINTFPPSSYRHKPAGIITYSKGAFGGVRVLSALRPFLTELGMLVVPAFATIPRVHDTLDEEGNTGEDGNLKHVDKVVREVEWYAKAIRGRLVNHPFP